jgi:hypothetical protein
MSAEVLVTGWFSFLHGEATAGDVLAGEAVAAALDRAGISYDIAWSPGFHPGRLHLERADPDDYRTVIFACGPLHSRVPEPGVPSPLLELHARYARCRRIAVGVSVLDSSDPAVTGFDLVLPRDSAASAPVPDLALAAPEPAPVPVVGVVLTTGQGEYGARRRHDEVAGRLTSWLQGLGVAMLPLDTRLDTRDWRLFSTPDQLDAVLRRVDVVVTTRLHGLVLGLRAGVPVLAVDPVAGGAKVSAQAAALGWPAVLPAGFESDALDEWWHWCRSPLGRRRAAGHTAPDLLTSRLIDAVGGLEPQVAAAGGAESPNWA